MGLSSLAFAFVARLLAARRRRGSSRAAAAPSRGPAPSPGCSRRRRASVAASSSGPRWARRSSEPSSALSSERWPRCSDAASSSPRSPGSPSCSAVWTLRVEPIPPEHPSTAACQAGAPELVLRRRTRARWRCRRLLCGVLSTLAPLQLADAGWGALADRCRLARRRRVRDRPLAARRANARPPWRVDSRASRARSRRRGLGRPRGGPTAAALRAAPDRCVGGAYGVLFTPAFALIADGAERSRLPQGMAFGLMNAAWALGALIGPAAGGAVAAATGDVVPFLVCAGLCAAALAAVRHARHRTTARAVPSDVAR